MAPRTFGLADGKLPSLTSRQFWLAALEVGETKASISAYVRGNYPAQDAGRAAIEVESSTSFERDHYLVGDLAGMKGIGSAELDALWLWASAL